jgi:tetratricopeptide (TPR) repeat protein
MYSSMGHQKEAEDHLTRALAIYEQIFGPGHASAALTIGNLAETYRREKRYEESAAAYKNAIALREKTMTPDDPRWIGLLQGYAAVCRALEQYAEAEKVEVRVTRIRVKNALHASAG